MPTLDPLGVAVVAGLREADALTAGDTDASGEGDSEVLTQDDGDESGDSEKEDEGRDERVATDTVAPTVVLAAAEVDAVDVAAADADATRVAAEDAVALDDGASVAESAVAVVRTDADGRADADA